jgi:hypothetical protein
VLKKFSHCLGGGGVCCVRKCNIDPFPFLEVPASEIVVTTFLCCFKALTKFHTARKSDEDDRNDVLWGGGGVCEI